MYLVKEILNNDVYKKKFLCNLYSYRLDFRTAAVSYKFLGIKFMKKDFERGKSRYTLFSFIRFKSSRETTANFLYPILFKFLKQKTGKEKFDIISLFNHAGETFLIFHHLKEFMRNNNINKPIFITLFPNLETIVKMFYPEATIIEIPRVFGQIHFSKESKKQIGTI